ncbi:hypothetical protein L6452_14581 [Arctium lappa]|uniref:Uncharacterized protein n=1 Tax=Arctium lappa TaxID=4217 RepID=A0ACB9CLR6_ARCLA|nr:hypothetical protein L6452_14581 [Arctium lappa]
MFSTATAAFRGHVLKFLVGHNCPIGHGHILLRRLVHNGANPQVNLPRRKKPEGLPFMLRPAAAWKPVVQLHIYGEDRHVFLVYMLEMASCNWYRRLKDIAAEDEDADEFDFKDFPGKKF